jgi:hypothetical protein
MLRWVLLGAAPSTAAHTAFSVLFTQALKHTRLVGNSFRLSDECRGNSAETISDHAFLSSQMSLDSRCRTRVMLRFQNLSMHVRSREAFDGMKQNNNSAHVR